jgi:SAM-dependent methyltransferase
VATVEANRGYWDENYDWANAGDEWSQPWGGPDSQWYSTLLPRIRSYLPTDTILEIGCGYGRWTHFLKDLCQRLIVIDLSEQCVRACQRRFCAHSNIQYEVNDGMSLAAVADASVDFVFSFDSLVHADERVLERYLCELARTLRPGGKAFLHHSNLGEYLALNNTLQRFPTLRKLLGRVGIWDEFCHLRDPVVSATLVRRLATASGLQCLSQEIVQWRGSKAMLDCMSLVVNSPSNAPDVRVCRNLEFDCEVRAARRLSQLYGSGSTHPRRATIP